MSPRRSVLVLAFAASLAGSQPEAESPTAYRVRTWSGRTIDARAIQFSTAALTIETGNAQQTLGWHEVHAIEGPRAADAAEQIALGKIVWRAGARLAKGDSFGAEPLFEQAFEQTRGTVGVTPAFVADGLLRCRLRRDARAAAIDAWLELSANLSVAPARIPNWGLSSPAVDPATRLVPSLPPIWFDSAPARAFANAITPEPSDQPGADAYAAAIRTLYRAAAQHAIGDPIDAAATARAAPIASERQGGALVARVVLAQTGGPELRAEARENLAREQSLGNERWRSVWATLAIGRSLIREPDEADVRRGILELLSIHAVDPDALPYFTAIALADAARAADAIGDDRAAAAIRDDLRRAYPQHPVRDLPGLAARPVRDPGVIP